MNNRLLLASSLCLVGCDRDAVLDLATSQAEQTHHPLESTAPAPEAPALASQPGVDWTVLEMKPLTGLPGREARAVCEEAGRRTDLCAVAGRNTRNAARCADTLATCRAQTPGPHTDCRDARFDFPEPCAASVGDYLRCISAWSDELSCRFDTLQPDTAPEQCLPLLQKCPYLESEFGPAAAIVPRCDKSTAPVRVDGADDIHGLDRCRPVPARMVTVGDSIAACFGVWTSPELCAPELLASYLREHYAPGLSYETHARGGAVAADLMRQAMQVSPGPGHVLVWAYMSGNDLARCQLPGMPETQACLDRLMATLPGQWNQLFAYFSDQQRFPDGVTFLINTQYSLWDQCLHPGGPQRGAFAEAAIQRFNRDVLIAPALERADTITIDQYPDWLGHAKNADRGGCPHCYRDDNAPWLFDGTHPNGPGNVQIADKGKQAVDRLYGGCMP